MSKFSDIETQLNTNVLKRKINTEDELVSKKQKTDTNEEVQSCIKVFKILLEKFSSLLEGEELINLSFCCKNIFNLCAKTSLWRIVCLKNVETLSGHLDAVNVISRLKTWTFSGSNDGKIKLWDANKWQCLRTLQMTQPVFSKGMPPGYRGMTREMTSAITALEAKGEYLFTGLDQGQVVMNVLVKKENSSHMRRQTVHTGKINQLKVAGDKLFSAGYDGKISMFQARNLHCLGHLKPTHKRSVIALETIGDRLYSASEDGNVMIWQMTLESTYFTGILGDAKTFLDTSRGRYSHNLPMNATHADKIASMTSWQEKLFTCGWDCELKLWSKEHQLLKKVFLNPLSICWTMTVRNVPQIEPHLLCAVRDGEIEMRSVEDLYLIPGTLSKLSKWSSKSNGHKSWINSIICFEDGRIVTGSDDWTIKVWHIAGSEHDKSYAEIKKKRALTIIEKSKTLKDLIKGKDLKTTDLKPAETTNASNAISQPASKPETPAANDTMDRPTLQNGVVPKTALI